jgi:hypothetical protein
VFEDDFGRSFTFRDSSGGRWEWYHILKGGKAVSGGLLAENVTQAICRDLFVAAMPRLEAAGYHLVLHLHDEVVCEVADGHGSLEEFKALITQPPDWARDFPLACKGRIANPSSRRKRRSPSRSRSRPTISWRDWFMARICKMSDLTEGRITRNPTERLTLNR